VEKARQRQLDRFKGTPWSTNAQLDARQTEQLCGMTEKADAFLRGVISDMKFSGRAFHKVIKVARTIADLEHSDRIELGHVQEAVHFRSLDRTQTD